jgi:hypothetical protein
LAEPLNLITLNSSAPTASADLASQGFIITATGLADNLGNVLMVGSRIQGDTMARPFVAAQVNAALPGRSHF